MPETPPGGSFPSAPGPSQVRAEGVHKAFGDNQVLRGVDLDVREGELVAVVGGSGSGKTVLLEHLIGHLKPDRGRVLIADHSGGRAGDAPLVDLATLDEDGLDRIRMQWAVVFQRNALFSGSVYDNIALWLRENLRMPEGEIRARAKEVLDAVGFEDEPDVIERDRDNLSGGMAKRVAIARALAMRPLLMFYDEPTTGLDPGLAAMIHELVRTTHLRAHPSGVRPTTIIVTHDKDLLRRLRPRVVMLHEGRVYFDGPFERFEAADSPIIRPYFDGMGALHQRRA